MTTIAFGKNPAGERLSRIKQSPNYKDGTFQNIESTTVIIKGASVLKLLKDHAQKPKTATPASEIPHLKTDLKKLNYNKPTVIWFGHSSYLIHSRGYNILVDPVFSGHASPVKFFGKPFPGTDTYKAEDFPVIDLLVLTHDHYDHLDYRTIIQIDKKVSKIITSLGVGSHLEHWHVDINKITEMDWWEEHIINEEIKLTATPARHFSGRGIRRAKTLWSSFVLDLHGYRIFIGGDSGYDRQFKIIGEKFGKFDLAFLECGQYGENWPYIHMHPEETIQAAKGLNAEVIFPVHWGKFVLANHTWNEPIKILRKTAQKEEQKVVSPMIGQPYTLAEEVKQHAWWDDQVNRKI